MPIFLAGRKKFCGVREPLLEWRIFPYVTAETPLPSKRLVIRSRKPSILFVGWRAFLM
jgi:hypothetical protein